jgi:disulfide bond formation protein DsbB
MNPRLLNLAGFCACAGLLGFAYYAQYQLHLEPCPLCILQRVGVFLIGVGFLLATLHGARSGSVAARIYAALIALAALVTAALAGWQLYIQSLPPGSIPDCGAPLEVMLRFMSPGEVLRKVLHGSGECARVDWRLLGLAMPAWVLMAAAVLGSFGVRVNSRRDTQAVRFR